MVAHKDSVQDVKIITELLKTMVCSESELSHESYCAWGKNDPIDSNDGYQVKRLTVNPGAKLSVQMHHRSEHWVVVLGQARVHYGAESHNLKVN